jgi:hypothetical protein
VVLRPLMYNGHYGPVDTHIRGRPGLGGRSKCPLVIGRPDLPFLGSVGVLCGSEELPTSLATCTSRLFFSQHQSPSVRHTRILLYCPKGTCIRATVFSVYPSAALTKRPWNYPALIPPRKDVRWHRLQARTYPVADPNLSPGAGQRPQPLGVGP